MKIEKYSFGVGDRFAHQGEAQLKAILKAKEAGIDIVPVWNKSNREHQIIHSSPKDTRAEADQATTSLGWTDSYYVDADHINLSTVDNFLNHSDFFTLDVADYIGKSANPSEIESFLEKYRHYTGELKIPGLDETFFVSHSDLERIAGKFFGAIKEASKIFEHIKKMKGTDNFIAEVSMDEVAEAQTPVEMFFILSMISHFNIPAQTIAPKFTGRFNKGVDYAGDIVQFRREFEQDLLVIDYAIKEFNLPDSLKLSVHSGSDKFSIYPVMGELIKKHDKGIHVKTAGTTWLEEVIGLAMAGGEALEMAKDIYSRAYTRQDELCGPYSTVIDINAGELPDPDDVAEWNGNKFAGALRHIPGNPDYNPSFRQLIHVGYKVAAELGDKFTGMLKKHHRVVGEQVTENIFERHLKRLFER